MKGVAVSSRPITGFNSLIALYADTAFVVITGDHQWNFRRKLSNAPEYIFWKGWTEIGNEFVIDRQVRRHDGKVLGTIVLMKVGNECLRSLT